MSAEVLTIEVALAELRALFPGEYISVQKKEGVWFHPPSGDGSNFNYFRIFVGGKNWRKETLSEALDAAKASKKQ